MNKINIDPMLFQTCEMCKRDSQPLATLVVSETSAGT